jgi:dolichyl-phosphate-mannose-protein mannosyltransferase
MSSAVATVAGGPLRERLDRVRYRLVRPLPDDGIWGWVLPLAITAMAAALRFWRLGTPGTVVFDETYYAHDANNLLHHAVELDNNHHDTGAGFVVHPPLGKWMIAVGQGLFGNNAFGWRFSAAVVGTLAVLMIARIARRMFRSTALGCVAGLLLSLDGLEFVQSRLAMLDIFLMFWVLAAFGALVLDRDQGRLRLADLAERRPDIDAGAFFLGLRPWRWACGFCLGAATATKWGGIFWVPAFLLLALWWDSGARRVAGARSPIGATLLRDGVFALLPFVVVVLAVYAASWTGWFLSDGAHAWDHDRYVHPGQSTVSHFFAVVGGWLRYHWEIYNFHAHLDAAHPYLSRPWGWLFLARPVAYFYASPKTCGASACSQEILGVGTPAIWWVSIPALLAVGWRAVARFDWRAAAILVAFFFGYLPWFREDVHHRTMFLFYLLPSLPFMVLAITMGLGMIAGPFTALHPRRVIGGVVAGVYLVAVSANFAYFYPVLSAKTITYQQWHDRMWLDRCDTKPHRNEKHENAPCWI